MRALSVDADLPVQWSTRDILLQLSGPRELLIDDIPATDLMK